MRYRLFPALICYLALPPVFADDLRIALVSPPAHSIAPTDTTVQVVFDRPIDPATVDASSFRVFGKYSGPAGSAPGNASVANSLPNPD